MIHDSYFWALVQPLNLIVTGGCVHRWNYALRAWGYSGVCNRPFLPSYRWKDRPTLQQLGRSRSYYSCLPYSLRGPNFRFNGELVRQESLRISSFWKETSRETALEDCERTSILGSWWSFSRWSQALRLYGQHSQRHEPFLPTQNLRHWPDEVTTEPPIGILPQTFKEDNRVKQKKRG